MPACPHCKGRLPLRSVLCSGFVIVCPRCYHELEPRWRWGSAVALVAGLLVWEVVIHALRLAGVPYWPAFLAGVPAYATVFVLLFLWLGRYRPKTPPLSILPTQVSGNKNAR